QGTVHKTVVMQRLTQEIQEGLLIDNNVITLAASKRSTKSDNAVERQVASIELNKFNRILFGQLIESIGAVKKTEIQNKNILRKLSVRDMSLIEIKHMYASIRLLPLEIIEKVIEETVPDEETRTKIFDGFRNSLGEDKQGRTE
ncbi:MAG: hypothetical protein WBP42_11505, partial [Candidatus Zixiibacteriota bacterium]